MKYVVIENFFDNIDKLLPGFKQIKRYPNNQHPDLKNAKLDKFYWPGFRSVELSDSPFLSLLFSGQSIGISSLGSTGAPPKPTDQGEGTYPIAFSGS